MIVWIKKLLAIVKNYEEDMGRLNNRINYSEKLIRDRTDIAADINIKDHNHIIVVGRYKNRDYVQTFTVRGDELNHLVETLKQMERHGVVRQIDAPPQFKAVFDRGW